MNLEPRIFTASNSPRPRNSTAIDPRDYVASTLIAQIADGWLIYSRHSGSADSTTLNRASVIRSLGQFLAEPGDRQLTLETSSSGLQRRLVEWERDLIATHGAESMQSKKASNTARQYVNAYLTARSIDNHLARRWATSKAIKHGDQLSQSIPLDEFSNSERLSIEQAFRDVVRAAERLLEVGDALLIEGQDPRKAGWDNIPNLVWALHNIPLEDIPDDVWRAHSNDAWWSKLHGRAPETEKIKDTIFGNPIIGLAIPNLFYLQAVCSLFLLSTGWSPEEVFQLQENDIDFDDTVVRVASTKNRASRRRHREFSSASRTNAKGWNPGDLLRRAERAMHTAKQHAPTNTHFWLGALSRMYRRNRSKTLPAWINVLPANPSYKFSDLTKKLGLELSAPLDVRRLRKTQKSAKAVLLGTLAGSAGDDHSIEVFREHYAQTTTVHVIAARTVIAAQSLVMNRIGPTVILDSAEHVARLGPASDIGRAARVTAEETPTEAMLSITSCSDPTKPPHSSAPQCMDAPNVCLNCSNSIIFHDHIPRLVAYRQILKEIESEMAPQQFAALYGQQISNLDAVLARVPEDDIHAATASPATIHVPLVMRKGR